MKYAVDSSILIDHLRNQPGAVELLRRLTSEDAQFVSSVIVRLEVLGGMRRGEERATHKLLELIEWKNISETECDAAAALARAFLPANAGIDSPDFLVAEVAQRYGVELLTMTVKHFPMFPGLSAPYSY